MRRTGCGFRSELDIDIVIAWTAVAAAAAVPTYILLQCRGMHLI